MYNNIMIELEKDATYLALTLKENKAFMKMLGGADSRIYLVAKAETNRYVADAMFNAGKRAAYE
ncbi:hypothetical protein [Listeria marthii]|uniref:hypothetical protein n=1 Tax=Listeria marthii TaxID=529731 RepID=UPI001626B136|nr:hypothetical protein [Listeria marthii]MBC2037895.1 hypothetical protein [Listeria marthii]